MGALSVATAGLIEDRRTGIWGGNVAKKLVARLGTVLATAAMIFGIGVGVANADVYGTHIQHAYGGYCLDGGNGSNGGDAVFNPCQHGNTYQEWNIESASGGVHIVEVQTGRCLAVMQQPDEGFYIGTETCGSAPSNLTWSYLLGQYGAEFYNGGNHACLDGNLKSVYPTFGLPTCQYSNVYQNWYTIYP